MAYQEVSRYNTGPIIGRINPGPTASCVPRALATRMRVKSTSLLPSLLSAPNDVIE